MTRKRTGDEQIAFALRAKRRAGRRWRRAAASGGSRSRPVSRWKKQVAGMGVPEIRRLKHREDENGKLKTLVADLTLDRAMLRGTCCTERGKGCRPARGRGPSQDGLRLEPNGGPAPQQAPAGHPSAPGPGAIRRPPCASAGTRRWLSGYGSGSGPQAGCDTGIGGSHPASTGGLGDEPQAHRPAHP